MLKFKLKNIKKSQIEKDLLFAIKSAIESTSIIIQNTIIQSVYYNLDLRIFEIVVVSKEKLNPQAKKGFNSQIQRQFELNGICVPYFIVWEKSND